MSKPTNRKAHVLHPVDLVAAVDELAVKPGGVFLTELTEREITIRRQREALLETAGAWKPEDHPELADGAAAWVRQIRDLDHHRFEELERRRDGKRPIYSI